MSYIWTLAEQANGHLKQVSFELLTRGRKLADSLDTKLASLLIGNGVSAEALRELIQSGADEVYYVEDPRLASFSCETYSNIMVELIKTYQPHTILAAATSSGRTLMPYVAVKVKTGLTADCTELDIEETTGNLLQTRPAIGGNILATIKTPNHRPQMATVRPKSTRPPEPDADRDGKIINVPFKEEWLDGRVEFLGYRKDAGDFENIEEADIIIAGGKGMKKAENFKMLRRLSDSLEGMVGATRDAVDRGWIGYSHQIGLSGKTVSPKLYIGAGISGSIQHLAGIKTSEIIVSINNDPEAPLHKIADFAIVGDLFNVLPELQKRLEGGK
ncbi:electron transfer flavoprotein subunit alpha/FixB family protein [Spirochaeta isovalerica]|uniref:Electron transfer flavoprotein alpha subunit n=1 Tax=Spirochaeta isovalerica TaxID=150 RepID=A0A841RGB2_9SPIO|nr:electron transfer flavoprotein subunit alpha/FixB family protein [Spirochaeta isovalerica]MBB6481568.1 electron transfer flavoprotein alpha subunit [Spirochaeta isovalerica]